MWFLSSVKIKKYFQTIQHFAFESKMIFNLFPYCSCHSHGLSLSQYALLGITIKTNMSEFKHLSTGQCLNTSRHGVRAEGVYPLKGKKQFLKDSSLWQLRSLSLYWVTVFSHHSLMPVKSQQYQAESRCNRRGKTMMRPGCIKFHESGDVHWQILSNFRKVNMSCTISFAIYL